MGAACKRPEKPAAPANNGNNDTSSGKNNAASEPATYKILIIGDPAVGKTSLLLRFVRGTFSGDTQNTVGTEEYLSKTIEVDGAQTTLNIWDTAGQEKFRTITSSYYRGAEGVIIVFDMSRTDTFDHVAKWHEQIVRYSSDDVPVVLVGNKSDLDKACDSNAITSLCKDKGMQYLEASASTGSNVDQIFNTLAKMIKSPSDDD